MSEIVLVTGATGTIGRHLVTLLKERGECEVRAMVRSDESAAKVRSLGATPVRGSFEDGASLRQASADADAAVLITPAHEKADLYARNFINAARKAELKHLVRVSALKAAPDGPTENTRLHARTERHLAGSGVPHTILRPHLFMQNLLISAQSLATDGSFSFSMGEGRMGMIDTRDIADCAAHCVMSDKHLGRTFELTGPQVLSWHEAASILSKLLGKQVAYAPVEPQQQFEALLEFGVDPWMAGVLRDYGTAYGRGWGDYTTDAVEEITGRPATGFDRFASDIIVPLLNKTGE